MENPLWAFFTYTVLAACNLMIAYGGSRILGLLQLFLELYIASAILMLIPQKGRAIAKHTISLIICVVCAVDLYCWNRLGSPITPTLLNTFRLTDYSEATEALSSYLDIRSILPALIPVTLGATHTVLASCKKCRSMIKDIAQKFCMHMGIATTALFVVSTTTCFKNEIYLFHRIILGHDEKETYMATDTEPTLRFYTPLHRLANAIVEIRREKDAIIHLQENIDNSHVDSCSFTSPEIVLIIGESYNKHHSQLYGYDKETTPKQMLHMNEGRLIPFSNAIAQWNLTSDAFRTLMSTDVATDENKWYGYPLFTVLFRKLHPLMAQKIMDASDKPVCTDNIAHMLLHLGGIHTPHYNRAFDPLSTEFDPTTKRIINGEHDYDSLSATWK